MKKLILVFAVGFFAASAALANKNYYREQLELEKARQLSNGLSGVTVAVLNTGINYRLPEFKGKIELDPANGSYGYDAIADTFDPFDAFGLGTQESSLVAGDQMGVAPGAKIVPIRIFDDNGSSSELAISKGIEYAVARDVEIILLAIGIGQPGNLICDALRKAAASGILVIAAAGNNAQELTQNDYPTVCDVRNILVVAASDKDKNLAKYSSFSFRNVHTAAPGEFIESIDHTGAIVEGRGTSFAAALTAGVAALVLSHNPRYSPLQVKEALIRGATRSAGLSGKVSSNGVLSAYKAMTVTLDE